MPFLRRAAGISLWVTGLKGTGPHLMARANALDTTPAMFRTVGERSWYLSSPMVAATSDVTGLRSRPDCSHAAMAARSLRISRRDRVFNTASKGLRFNSGKSRSKPCFGQFESKRQSNPSVPRRDLVMK